MLLNMARALALRLPAGLLSTSMPVLDRNACSKRSWCSLFLERLFKCPYGVLLAKLNLLSSRDGARLLLLVILMRPFILRS